MEIDTGTFEGNAIGEIILGLDISGLFGTGDQLKGCFEYFSTETKDEVD